MAAPAPTHYELRAGGDPRTVQVLRASNFYSLELFVDTIDQVRTHNLDTVEGRNDAIAKFDEITKQAKRGRQLFTMSNPGTQFPNGWDDSYLCEYDDELVRLLTMLRRQLTYRETAVAKDSQAGRQQQAPSTGITMENSTQSNQDNKKAISELIIELKRYANKRDHVWDRSKFEQVANLHFVP